MSGPCPGIKRRDKWHVPPVICDDDAWIRKYTLHIKHPSKVVWEEERLRRETFSWPRRAKAEWRCQCRTRTPQRWICRRWVRSGQREWEWVVRERTVRSQMDRKEGVGFECNDAVPTCEYWHRRLGLHRFVVFHVEKVGPSGSNLSVRFSYGT